MSLIYLSLGSNLNDRFANLRRAINELQQFVTVTAISPVFATEPWGDTDQPPFLNICVAVAGDLSPHEMLHRIKEVECRMGREKTRHWGPRLIDIDILFYDKLILKDDELTIPHPFMAERAFVLAPLAVIIPDFIHPQTGLSVQEMLEKVDMSGVERLVEMPFPASHYQTAAESV
ncbi:MAG: 2-amino-4-hydroxy-6-hydroxymethyldihydropteridine diphosphokinase [Candidatus Promineofilum sp.]|nr:2-amino-4-hydroxy-6-hydroxymethyldihydropteridine diphosphokinase [Promineifilum sp.]